MNMFTMRCFLLCILAAGGTSSTDPDVNELTDELLDLLLSKKSSTDPAASDDEELDNVDRENDLRILEAILSEDEEELSNLETRMGQKKLYNEFLDNTFIPKVTQYMFDQIKDLPNAVVRGLLKDNDSDFACQIVNNRRRPKWLATLKRVFPEVKGIAEEICDSE